MANIRIEAYGCSASFADSEIISGLITNGGHTITQNPKDADLNLIVTCSVKDATASKMIHRMKTLSSRPLVVAGCLSKAEPNTVQKLVPKASLLGPNSLGSTLDVVNSALQGRKKISLNHDHFSKVGIPKIRLNPIVGIVEIASGCMSECTFCQTKLAKEELQSYRMGDIVRQIKQDITDGCKEIWLTSTDNGCYGLDINTTLPELIQNITEIPGDYKIRVGMMNPMYMAKISDELLKAYDDSHIYKFLHIPVQSGSDKVLHGMKRGHTRNTFENIVKKFRSKFTDMTISTDIIVGFPTEGREDLQDTITLLKNTRPEIVNLSKFSNRPGTFANDLTQLDSQEIKRRSKQITEIINKISEDCNRKWLNRVEDVQFVEESTEGVRGRNFAYKSIYVKKGAKLGKQHRVKITKCTRHALYGNIVC